MGKIKITEVQLKDECLLHNERPILNLKSEPLHKLFDFENEDLKYIIFKDFYSGEVSEEFLDKLLYTRMLSKLLNLTIIEDETLMNEAPEKWFVSKADGVKTLLAFESKKVNPYEMDFDHTKLKKEKNGSYTFNNAVCIESNNRTTEYFREKLILENINGNVLLINAFPENVKDYSNHKFIEHHFKSNSSPANEKLIKYASKYNDFTTAGNVILAEMLTDNEDYIEQIIEDVNSPGTVDSCYKDVNLEVIEGLAKKLKKPKLLFDELIKSNNQLDRKRGFINLGFK